MWIFKLGYQPAHAAVAVSEPFEIPSAPKSAMLNDDADDERSDKNEDERFSRLRHFAFLIGMLRAYGIFTLPINISRSF